MAIAATAATGASSQAGAFFLVQAQAVALEPGSYLWEPSLASSGSFNVVVDLTLQRLFVYRGGTLIGISTISSGKPGYETPTGSFTVLEKERFHNSNKYDDAPMPYMERLSWSGLALHAGHPRGYPASHGCIRLPMGFASALFKEQTRGMQVVITGHAPSAEEIRIANHENAPTNPQCCEANDPTETDNSRATKFPSRPDEPDAPQSPSCCTPGTGAEPAMPRVSPECADAPGDYNAANDSDVNDGPEQAENIEQPQNACNGDNYHNPGGYRRPPDTAGQYISSPQR